MLLGLSVGKLSSHCHPCTFPSFRKCVTIMKNLQLWKVKCSLQFDMYLTMNKCRSLNLQEVFPWTMSKIPLHPQTFSNGGTRVASRIMADELTLFIVILPNYLALISHIELPPETARAISPVDNDRWKFPNTRPPPLDHWKKKICLLSY